MFKRARYQSGYLRQNPRKSGADVWVWERNATGPDGRCKREAVIIGDIEQYPTESIAWRGVESFRLAASTRSENQSVLFGALIDRYMREKLPKRYSTASTYRSWLINHIKPKWGDVLITKIKLLLVESGLRVFILRLRAKGIFEASCTSCSIGP